MKNLVLVSLMTLTGLSSFAQVGGPVAHTLSCKAPKSESGVPLLFHMECFTQPVSPQYSLKGCDLYSAVIAPNAQTQKIDLTMVKQTAKRAYLVNEEFGISVVVKKADMSAFVRLEDAVMKCKSSDN